MVNLPSPPSDREKVAYINQNKILIYTFGVVSFVSLMIGMVMFSIHHDGTMLYLAFTLVVGVYLSISYLIGVFSRSFDFEKHYDVVEMFKDFKPAIDVYLPSCGEPLEVLENTFKWVRKLDWPEGALHVYVLDDSGRRQVELLADRYEFTYISRPNRGEMKKAGNIRYAFAETSSPFFLILDADFVPRADMLKEMVPYFAADPKVAIVQSPQYFSLEPGQSWIQKGSAYIQELFYRLIQVNRDHWDASICVGTCAIYRREPLVKHGGTYPIQYSEDMHTGWQMTIDGFKVRYIPVNLTKGLCPDTMSAFWVQQTRWCTGSTGLFLSKKFWTNRMKFMQRICYMSGMMYYFATALGLIITPLPAIIMVWFFPEYVFWYNYLFSLPSFVFSILVLAAWGRAPFGAYVMSSRLVSYYAHLFALWDRFKGTMVQWVPTGNAQAMKGVKRYHDFKSVMFTWTTLSTGVLFAGACMNMHEIGNYHFYPALFFSAFNYWVAMRCFVLES